MSFLNKEEFENVANNIESGNIPPFVMIDNYVEDIGEHYNFKEVYTKLSDVGNTIAQTTHAQTIHPLYTATWICFGMGLQLVFTFQILGEKARFNSPRGQTRYRHKFCYFMGRTV